MIKQPNKKKPVKKADHLDLEEKAPLITQDIEVVRETAPKPDPNFIPRIPGNDPPRVVEEIPRRNPNGNPFDTMYARQRKAR